MTARVAVPAWCSWRGKGGWGCRRVGKSPINELICLLVPVTLYSIIGFKEIIFWNTVTKTMSLYIDNSCRNFTCTTCCVYSSHSTAEGRFYLCGWSSNIGQRDTVPNWGGGPLSPFAAATSLEHSLWHIDVLQMRRLAIRTKAPSQTSCVCETISK